MAVPAGAAFLLSGKANTRRRNGHTLHFDDVGEQLKRPTSFRCAHCRFDVSTSAVGTAHRNYCPNCLWSKHVDDVPGDRAADCGSSMEPIAITVRNPCEQTFD